MNYSVYILLLSLFVGVLNALECNSGFTKGESKFIIPLKCGEGVNYCTTTYNKEGKIQKLYGCDSANFCKNKYEKNDTPTYQQLTEFFKKEIKYVRDKALIAYDQRLSDSITKKAINNEDFIDQVKKFNYKHECCDTDYYKLLHGKKESDYEAIKTIKFIIRICTTEKYLESFNDFHDFIDYNINQAYDDCVNENKLFMSLAYQVTTLNCVIGYEKIQALNETVMEMFNMIKNEFKIEIQKKKWLDEISRKNILEKIGAMEGKIFYLERLFGINVMENVYGKLNYTKKIKYGKFREIIATFIIDRQKENIYHFTPKLNPLQIDAWYQYQSNTFFAFFGMLREPIFDLNLPTAMKFGGYGSVIGHEIIHGFDEEGIRFTKFGKDGELLSGYSKEKYMKRRQCMIDQYNDITYLGGSLKVNGTFTLMENIADNGGIEIAYRAFKKY
uniref:Peptidase_M13 domain-containing protein n=1 Tax=Parastrongyloides trichosuri TaxID=131310 RepID=A0A0N5A4I5_PARTI